MSIVRVENAVKTFTRGASTVHAVNDVSFDIGRGETLALIGESGSGKSTMGRLILGLHSLDSGSIWFDDVETSALSRSTYGRLRARMTVVFQEPFQSLNPRMSIGQIVEEPLQIHRSDLSKQQRQNKVDQTLSRVALDPDAFRRRFPHELSGGQQQRVGIARALVTDPEFIVLDEPTSSLDLSVRAQILQLLIDLKAEFHLSYLFISHDIQTVEYLSDRIAVMYFGTIVETGRTADVFENPRHPYTRALLSSSLSADPDVVRQRLMLEGEIPSPTSTPSGCVLCRRCPVEIPECSTTSIPLIAVEGDHRVACIVETNAHNSTWSARQPADTNAHLKPSDHENRTVTQ